MGLRDELNYPQSPFSSVTESSIMNLFYFLAFYDVQGNQGGFDTITEALSKPEGPLRSPVDQSSRQGAERDCEERWRREGLCSEKKFRALLIHRSQRKAEMCCSTPVG